MNEPDRIVSARLCDIERGLNVRKHVNKLKLKEMVVSVRSEGVLVPLDLIPGTVKQYRILEGFCRFYCAMVLRMESVPARIWTHVPDDRERLLRQLIVNCHRQDYRPLEKARGIAELMQVMGWNSTQAAKHVGMSPAGITRSMTLLTAAEPIQRLIEEGRLAESTAYQILLEKSPEKQLELANAAANGASRDAIVAAVKRAPISAMQGEKSPMARAKVVLGDGASLTVAATDLTLERYIAYLKTALAKATKAHSQALSLREHVIAQRDEAKGTSSS